MLIVKPDSNRLSFVRRTCSAHFLEKSIYVHLVVRCRYCQQGIVAVGLITGHILLVLNGEIISTKEVTVPSFAFSSNLSYKYLF